MTNIPLLQINNVSKVFRVGGTLFRRATLIRAVDNVSFTLDKGEVVALIGESGCGKSTLGRLVLGLVKPTSGQILYKGEDIWRMDGKAFREFRRNAQIVHQDPYDTLNPMRTIYGSIAPGLYRYRIVKSHGEAWERAAELLKQVGLEPPEDFLRRHPSRLSGGQMQRIAIARAISVEPSFIVADEAVAMLDASLRISILDLLRELQQKLGLGCFFISHDIAVARYICRGGRALVMYLGSIVEEGGIEDLLREPLHPYTEVLLSTIPIPDPKLTRSRDLPRLRSLEIPSAANPPSGCKFHTRCPYALDICSKETPELREVKAGRLVACHLRS
ncbi:MAG: ABC transporter ATP-binding protein [Candidatus Bathyarchaeia archaeon]